MPTTFFDRRTLDFILHDWLGQGSESDSRETTSALLDLSERIAENQFLSHYKKSDREEPHATPEGTGTLPEIHTALKTYAEAGLFGAGFPAKLGGLDLPFATTSASLGLFMAANIATSAFIMLTVANARLIATFGTPTQIDYFARPQIEGRIFGTMCLSEPQAGSSLGDIKTTARPDGEDRLGRRFRLTGNKMWISGGDHEITSNIIHLVLAKIPNADGTRDKGTRGISLFIVPKRLEDGSLNDIAVAGLNHKMGYRGIPNCLLNFGEGAAHPEGQPGAIGYLIGEPGQGLPIMFQMMNEARIGVGLGAAALAMRGFRHAVDYAQQRPQGRPPSGRGAGDPVPIIEHADVKRMLLAQKAYAEGALALVLYCAHLVDLADTLPHQAGRDDAARLLGLLTPIAKTWPSEWGLVANDLAIQVHGGYGYTRDFDVEQIYRDNRLNPIHEGTTGIQSIDLLGRKILRDRTNTIALLGARIADCASRASGHPPLARLAIELNEAWQILTATIDALAGLNDDARALENATPFLFAFGHTVVAWLWLDQAIICASDGADPFNAGKIAACRFFFESELPKLQGWLTPIRAFSTIASEMTPAQF
jgi:alkylation response protein AidB-like acyl-CoA dehydrogenase